MSGPTSKLHSTAFSNSTPTLLLGAITLRGMPTNAGDGMNLTINFHYSVQGQIMTTSVARQNSTKWSGRLRNMPVGIVLARTNEASQFLYSTKRQRAGALQDVSRIPETTGKRASVLDCGGPPPLLILLFRRPAGTRFILHANRGRCPRLISAAAPQHLRLCTFAGLR